METPGFFLKHFFSKFSLWLCAISLMGCNSTETLPPLPLADVQELSSNKGAKRLDRWWEVFESSILNQHIEEALASNYSLKQSYFRLMEARSLARKAGAGEKLSLDANAGLRQREGDSLSNDRELSLGVEAAYEADLWGKVRLSIREKELLADASLEDLNAAAISLSAEVASTVFSMAEAKEQLELSLLQQETQKVILKMIETRFKNGSSTSIDRINQKRRLESARRRSIQAEASYKLLQQQLAILKGRPPQEDHVLDAPKIPDTLPPLPEVGLPSELMKRRPDVKAAFLNLKASNSALAAMAKAKYPTLDLRAVIGTSARNPTDLFDAWVASLTGQLVLPILDGKSREEDVRRASMVQQGRLKEYAETVINAFGEVEASLLKEKNRLQQIESLKLQLKLARKEVQSRKQRYLNGSGEATHFLEAAEDGLALEREILQEKRLLLQDRIQLHRALAGSFDLPPELSSISQPTASKK